LAENLNTLPPKAGDPGLMLLVLIAVEFAVLVSTLLPAWRGGKVNTIQAITTGYRQRHGRASRLARLAAGLRLPVVVVLGIKDTFSRPLRTNMSILGLAMTSTIAIMAVQANSSGNDLSRNKVYFNGTSAQIRIERNFVPHETIQNSIINSSSVEQSYAELGLFGLSPNQIDQPLFFRFLTDGYQDFDFQLKEGRMFEFPGEAVVVYGVLDTLGADVGDTIDLVVDGAPIQLTIVGRYLEAFNTGHVIMTSMDTYLQQVDPTGQPNIYYADLFEETEASEFVGVWQDRFQGLVDAEPVSEEPQASMSQFVSLITSLGLIMTGVASVNLMSTSALSIRERVRDFGIQKSLGVTPGQIAGGVVVGTILIALLGLITGSIIGVNLMDEFIANVGIQLGIGTDFYDLDWTWISALVPAMVFLAIFSSLWPAWRAARLEVVEALRYE
jgi:putative ABC transport system permease protein